MKTILCYGDSNTWGAVPLASFDNVARFGPEFRWTGVLRANLGDGYWIIEEGLNGRTTVWPDPVEGEYKSGKSYLPACLESHAPLDIVVLMLGTNDLMHKFGLSASDVSLGIATLIRLIQRSTAGPDNSAPRVLLMCPPPITTPTLLADMFADAPEKSRHLAGYFAKVASDFHCDFLDAGAIVTASHIDGIHLDAQAQQVLGRAVAAKIQSIFERSTANP